MRTFIFDFLTDSGITSSFVGFLTDMILVFIIIILSVLGNFLTKKIVLKYLSHYIMNNKFKWDNVLVEKNVFQRLSHIIPALIIYFFAGVFPDLQDWIQRFAFSYILIVSVFVIDAFLNSLDEIYRSYEISKEKPIKGYLQVAKIFVYILVGIIVISVIIDKSPLILLSGFGALTAVLMLIFKDSILGLVAGIQLASNDMIHIGDWIEMPKYGADGDVIDLSLNTVKIQNFDRTITTIPTYALISDSFKNWRGMQNSGGRRIKRSIHIDTTSITFCSSELIERFKKIDYLSEYIYAKLIDIEKHNQEHEIDPDEIVNGRRLTNIGTFRAYISNYLKEHPKIHKNMIRMVRQLPPEGRGLPLEIYVFTNDTNWINYEGIQADIFDHILAVAPEFGLRIFQEPTGYDIRSMRKNIKI